MIDYENYFDVCYVINLDRRPDRLQQFTKALPDDWPFKIPKRYRAIDGDLVGCPVEFRQGNGAFGCMRSHTRILEESMLDGLHSVLIMEDDAVCLPHFAFKVKQFLQHVPENWDALYLGGQMTAKPTVINDHVLKINRCGRTHCYAARGKFIRELYTRWAMCDVHIDWRQETFLSQFNVYAPREWLIAQEAGSSDISGNMDARRAWIPPKGNEPIILLDAPKDVVAELRQHHGIHTGNCRNPKSDIDVGLLRIFDKPAATRYPDLRKWIIDLQWETVSMPNTVLAVWHPRATKEEIAKAYTTGPLWEITATNLGDAVAQIQKRKAAIA